ncbi:MAG: glutathione S-transferase N-terminal domain-containing protein, partial [Candidatus Polarisedimenticolia bacterium]
LELYQFEGCPYCASAREALDDLGLDYIVRSVPHDSGERDRVRAISGQDLVPVLIDPERQQVVADSRAIILYLKENYTHRA